MVMSLFSSLRLKSCGSLLLSLSLFIPLFYSATITIDWGVSVGNVGTKSIAPGDTVIWEWIDSSTHTVTSDDGGFTSSGSKTGVGQTYSVVFPTVGTYPFYCAPHPSMQGRIAVATPTIAPSSSPSITMSPTKEKDDASQYGVNFGLLGLTLIGMIVMLV